MPGFRHEIIVLETRGKEVTEVMNWGFCWWSAMAESVAYKNSMCNFLLCCVIIRLGLYGDTGKKNYFINLSENAISSGSFDLAKYPDPQNFLCIKWRNLVQTIKLGFVKCVSRSYTKIYTLKLDKYQMFLATMHCMSWFI